MKKIISFVIVSLFLCAIPQFATSFPARAVYKQDGTVSVIHPSSKSKRTGETQQEWLDRVFAKAMQAIDDVVDFEDIDSSQIPTDRTYRNEWTGSKGNGIKIDTVKKKAKDDKGKLDKEIEKLKKAADKLIEDQAKDNLGM